MVEPQHAVSERLRGTLVVHGTKSAPIAKRLAMDLSSGGIPARPLALGAISDSDWETNLPAVNSLVIVYDGQTQITDTMEKTLDKMHPTRPVVFVRTSTSRFPDYLNFHVVLACDMRGFSYYQSQRGRRGGIADVILFLGGGKRPRDSRRRGFAFVSYSSNDRAFINEGLVPALAACDVGFFDYRFTERLNERKLDDEIDRWIGQSAVVIVCASSSWPMSRYTRLEKTLARRNGRPIVAVFPPGDECELHFAAIHCRFRGMPDEDAAELGKAIEVAISRGAVKAAKRQGGAKKRSSSPLQKRGFARAR